jgi:hypothetical protein
MCEKKYLWDEHVYNEAEIRMPDMLWYATVQDFPRK